MCFLSTDGKYFFICYKDGKNKISYNKYIKKQNSLSNFLPCLFFFPRQSGLNSALWTNKIPSVCHFLIYILLPNTLKIIMCTKGIESLQLAAVVQYDNLKCILACMQTWKADSSQCRTIWLSVTAITCNKIFSFTLTINLS